MANILITGGAGFIGSALAEELSKDHNNQIIILDNLITGSLKKVPVSPHKNIHFVKGDVNDRQIVESVFKKSRIDFLFHYAALVGVKRTLDNPVDVLHDIDGIKALLDLAVKHHVQRVYYSSSSEVYGEPVHIPQNEYTTPLNSRLPYAIVKNVGEAFLKSYHQSYGLEYTIFRFFNTYGPKQSEDFVVAKFLNAALKNEDITIYGDGKQTRTFCYIDDNVNACVTIFKQQAFKNDVVNIGSDIEVTVIDLARTIIRLTKSTSIIIHLPALEEGDMTRRLPDITKMKTILQNLTPLESGLLSIIKQRL